MKLKQLACLSLVAGAAAGVSAHAQHTIKFSGNAQQQTCVIDLNGGGGGGGTVNMGQASISDFPVGGGVSSAAPTVFTIGISGCAVGSHPFATFYHTNVGSIDAVDSTLLKGPNNLALRLYVNDGAGTAIHPATSQPMFPWRHANDPVITTDASGDALLTYKARYVSTGTIIPGAFETFANYVVAYD